LGGDWRRLHIEDLCNLYASPNIIRVINSRKVRWVGHVASTVETTETYKMFARIPKGWEGNIRIELRQTRWEVVD
jgi:hypothetical protein